MTEKLTGHYRPKQEYDPRHVSRYGLRTIEKDGELVEVHNTNNLRELYEAYWRQGQAEIPPAHNPVQDAYLQELTGTGDGQRMLRILDSVKDNPANSILIKDLDNIAELRYRIQETRARGQEVELDSLERDLWDYHHSKLFDVLIPEIQKLDSSLDPNLFLR